MGAQSRWPGGLSQILSILLFLAFAIPTKALYFYFQTNAPKCFYEELPKDTMVVGHYKAENFNHDKNAFLPNPDITVLVTVDEVFDNDHRVVNTKGSASGKFTFSAADAGDHRICFAPSVPGLGGGWMSGGKVIDGMKMTLDLAIGETSQIESTDKGKILDIVTKVKDLNGRLQDIRREQVFQREREAEFRDQSESTNARVVRWTLLQLVVLGVTCAWQLSHLRAFFIKQKLT
ncbi:MAG: hypothetical protein LQ348_002179 [Seirophora lacunosa]|nr:MAG: hypothetical protein LQ348_002179 [Seirophora lacunosa]